MSRIRPAPTGSNAWPDAPLATRMDLNLEDPRVDSGEGHFDTPAERGLRVLLDERRLDPALVAADCEAARIGPAGGIRSVDARCCRGAWPPSTSACRPR